MGKFFSYKDKKERDVKRILTLTGIVFLGFIAFTLVKVARSQESSSRAKEPVVDYIATEAPDFENTYLRMLRGCRYDR